MIPAQKHRLFNAWFAGHARSKIHKAFDKVCIQGISKVREALRDGPALVVSNHTSWWDPLVVLHLSTHLLGADGHALMDAKNLRRLPFFALVGAFGVDLDRPEDGALALRYAAKLLDRPGRLVWIFPQGTERPITERPLGFRPGAAEIARLAKRAVTIPAAIRYEMAGTERPSLLVSFGDPIARERDVAAMRARQEDAVAGELDRIERAARGDEGAGFAIEHLGREGVMAAIATWMLARIVAVFTGISRRSGRLGPG